MAQDDEDVEFGGVEWDGWEDLSLFRARLDAGADPNPEEDYSPLHMAAESGSAEVVAELAGRVDDVDAELDGRTALWVAVCQRRPDIARVLYPHNAVACSCAYTALRLTDARAITGPPDTWLRLPPRDYWQIPSSG